MKRSIFETLLGAAVLGLAGYFFVFSYKTADVGTQAGYSVSATFSGLGGLTVGDEVQISGVKVGIVERLELDPDSYLARVHMHIENNVELPTDTAALIGSDGLLGGRHMSLEPGAEEEFIPAGGMIQFTQAPQNLEQLLGQFIFSMQSKDATQ